MVYGNLQEHILTVTSKIISHRVPFCKHFETKPNICAWTEFCWLCIRPIKYLLKVRELRKNFKWHWFVPRQKQHNLPEMHSFPLQGNWFSSSEFCLFSTSSVFLFCSSDMYPIILVLDVSRFFAASSSWWGLLDAANSLAVPSRILISWSIFCCRYWS